MSVYTKRNTPYSKVGKFKKRITPYLKFTIIKAIFDRIVFDFLPFDQRKTKISAYQKRATPYNK